MVLFFHHTFISVDNCLLGEMLLRFVDVGGVVQFCRYQREANRNSVCVTAQVQYTHCECVSFWDQNTAQYSLC